MQTAGDGERGQEPAPGEGPIRTPDPNPGQTQEPAGNDPAPPPEGFRGWYERVLGNRPLQVYGILLGGVAVLTLLLVIVYWTGRDDSDRRDSLVCLPFDRQEAARAIAEGQVERVTVLTDQDRPALGPVAVELDLLDQSCRELPKGIGGQAELNEIIGMVTVFNEVMAGERRIQTRWEQQANIPAALLSSPTPTPTDHPPPDGDGPPHRDPGARDGHAGGADGNGPANRHSPPPDRDAAADAGADPRRRDARPGHRHPRSHHRSRGRGGPRREPRRGYSRGLTWPGF